MDNRCEVKHQIISEGGVLNDVQQNLLNYEFSADDVKQVMNSISNEKAPRMDGYNSFFFKKT